MSRQEMRVYGKQEFGTYPLITMEPRPETLEDYFKVKFTERMDIHIYIYTSLRTQHCFGGFKTRLKFIKFGL